MTVTHEQREACNVRFRHLEDEMKSLDQCMITFKRDLVARPRTPTLITIAVIVVGIVGAILGSLWGDLGAVHKKVDLIREDQVKVMTTLEIHVEDTNNGGNRHGRP